MPWLHLQCHGTSNFTAITNGFTKKTNKTPKSEIELAKFRRADYYGRYGNGEKSDFQRRLAKDLKNPD
ncbi:type II toxin-antitoxin system RelE/ParE family toxin [Pseudobutyrivibrio sp. ACV-2]|uniref:type II toxin-antitoxin system RelE/ParE family toxin n=1 Tax=Pseudobutyrivibrio sp. ACV-2 TaxID=1520801 RepID=UPI003FA69774